MQLIFQFVGCHDIASEAIAWFSHGSYSHVDLVASDGGLQGARSDEVGGKPAGVYRRTPDYASWNDIARVTIEVSMQQYNRFWQFADSKVGTPYNQEAIVGFMLGNDLNNKRDLFCSQYALESASVAEIFAYPCGLPSCKVDPDMLFAILSTYGAISVIK